MRYVHIENSQNIPEINALNNASRAYLLYYLQGCGPCNQVRPVWRQLSKDVASDGDDSTILAEVNQEMFPHLQNTQHIQKRPFQFPTIRFVSFKGTPNEQVEEFTGDRDLSSFKNWIAKHQKTNKKRKKKTKTKRNGFLRNKKKTKKNKTQKKSQIK
jgi:hypothetical protein